MPGVPKTSHEAIVAAARKIIDEAGLAALSLQEVAHAVGVQAPSLYKRFADRAELVRTVAQTIVAELVGLIEHAAVTGTPRGDLRAIAVAHRRFAHRSPHLYQLVFGIKTNAPEAELTPEEYRPIVAMIVDRMTSLSGRRDALSHARLLVAFTHGFAMMELNNAFRMGGDLDVAFHFGLDRVLEGVMPTPTAPRGRRPALRGK